MPARGVVGRPWPVRYLVQSVATVAAILRIRPSAVLVTNPPFVALLACAIARPLGIPVWADCHSAAFDKPRWRRFSRVNLWLLRHASGTIFHNAAQQRRYGHHVRRSCLVSTDGMRDRAGTPPRRTPAPLVVVPSSYEYDEPVDAILQAARLLPSCSFVLTGATPATVLAGAPANVRSSGWLPDGEYHELLACAWIVVCLTTRDAAMQGGLLEGLEHAKPTVTSGSPTLREWARGVDGVQLVGEHSGGAIAAALTEILADYPAWEQAAKAGSATALARARAELDDLRAAVSVSAGRAPASPS